MRSSFITIMFNKIIKIGLYGTLFLPLLFTSFTYFPWNFGKTIIFQIVVEILLLLYIIGRAISRERRAVKRLNWLDWSLIIFLLVITATSFVGVNLGNSFWGNQARSNGIFTWLHFGVWYFLFKRLFSEKKDWIKLFSVAVGVATLVCISVFFQNSLPNSWQSEAGGGIIGNRAFAAAYLLVALGLALVLVSFFKDKGRYIYLSTAFVLLAAIFWIGNRGAILGIVAGGFGGLIAALYLLENKKIRVVLTGVLVGGIAVVGMLALSVSNKTISTYFPWLPKVINVSSFTSGTGETRLMAWNIAWQGIKERPLVGWGWGNYDVTFNKYFNPHFLKYNFTETVWDKPHNWLLEIANNSGIFGLVGYLAIFGSAVYYLVLKKREQENTADQVTRSIIFGILMGYLATSLFLFETSNTMLLWFLLLAFISKEYGPQEGAVPDNSSFIVNRSFGIAGLFLLLISLFSFNYVPLKASYFLSKAHAATSGFEWAVAAQKALAVSAFMGEKGIFLAERFVQLDRAGVDMKSAQTVAATIAVATALENQSNRYSNNPLFPVWGGQMYMILGETIDPKYFADAERLLLRAQAISPKKQEFLFFLGRLYLLKKDFSRAIAMQNLAVAADPSISISHWFFGLTYIASGDAEAGLREIELAITLGYALTLDQRLYLIDIYAGAKKYGKVVEGYKYLVSSDPGNVDWYIKLATAYAITGQKSLALDTVNKAIDLYPPLGPEADKFIKQYKLK